jgi:uncharacterized protein (TIGR03435 family)
MRSELLLASVLMLALPMGAQGVPAAAGQTQVAPPVANFSYEVASITPNNSDTGNSSINTNNDSYTAVNVGLKAIIEDAYDLLIPEQIVGLPGWVDGARFDIKAKMDAETAARLKALKGKERDKAQDMMMQNLLAERFGLKVHREMRELPEYALVQAKGGSKLKPADATIAKAGSMSVRNGHMEGYSGEMQQLLYFLSYQVRRPVVDRTGLTGKFDITLDWTREDMMSASSDSTTEKAPGLFTALQEQLGLKLESIKGPVDTVVVDHIDHPTEN